MKVLDWPRNQHLIKIMTPKMNIDVVYIKPIWLIFLINSKPNKINIIDQTCCDVLLSEYLRRKNDNLYFGQIKINFIGIGGHNNNSITHYITSQDKYTNKSVNANGFK